MTRVDRRQAMSDSPVVMWSIGQIAERDGISRQAISKIVKKLVADHDIPVERDGRGRVAKVSVAHYDHHRCQFTNPAKRKAIAPPGASEPDGEGKPNESFEEARRQGEWIRVQTARIRHQEEIGRLVRADRLRNAHKAVGREINAAVGRLQNRADEMALAVSREGAHGLRVMLREVAFDLNADIARRLDKIALDAPQGDEAIDSEMEG